MLKKELNTVIEFSSVLL